MAKLLKGSEELKKKLLALKGVSSQLEVAGLAGGAIIHTAIVKRAPYLTGTYRRSITIRSAVQPTKIVVTIGTNIVYGPRLEFGFRGRDAKGRNYSQSARPHFRPGFDENKAAAIREIETILKMLMTEAAS
jgi:hypothetical protein